MYSSQILKKLIRYSKEEVILFAEIPRNHMEEKVASTLCSEQAVFLFQFNILDWYFYLGMARKDFQRVTSHLTKRHVWQIGPKSLKSSVQISVGKKAIREIRCLDHVDVIPADHDRVVSVELSSRWPP